MPNNNLLWSLICVLLLVVGLVAGRMGLVGHPANTPSKSNFRDDFPLKQIRERTFKNETVSLDGNEYIGCTFDNVVLRFDGQAPFRFTNDHFEKGSKFGFDSGNPAIEAIIRLMSTFMKLEATTPEQPAQQ
jgi:hypothetical protein